MIALRVPLKQICAEPGMPSQRTLYSWRRRYPEFDESIIRARVHRAEARSDYIDDIAADLRAGRLDPHSAKVLISSEQWLASRENPTRYGDRIAAEVTGKDGKDLIPEQSAKEWARAALDLLREARLEAQRHQPTTVLTPTAAPRVEVAVRIDSAPAEPQPRRLPQPQPEPDLLPYPRDQRPTRHGPRLVRG